MDWKSGRSLVTNTVMTRARVFKHGLAEANESTRQPRSEHQYEEDYCDESNEYLGGMSIDNVCYECGGYDHLVQIAPFVFKEITVVLGRKTNGDRSQYASLCIKRCVNVIRMKVWIEIR